MPSKSLPRSRSRLAFLAVAGLVSACTTETIVSRVTPPTTEDAGAPPVDPAADAGPTADAGPPVDRSVKGTWEKILVKTADGDPIEKMASVVVRSPNDVYVAEGASNLGTGYFHYDGKQWTGVRYSGFATSLAPLSSGELLGYGSDLFIKTKAGDAWERIAQPQGPGSPAAVRSVWGLSSTDFYASTSAGNVRFDGDSWSIIPGVDTHQGQFAGVNAKDVWFAANGWGQLAHYDGTSWTNHWDKLPAEITRTPTDGPYSVFATGADDVWAMGRRRTVIHYDGSKWSVVPGPDDEWGCDLTRFWASSKKNAWLVGKGGCVFHWDGALWEKIPSGVTDDIFGIHGSDPEHVWIAPYSDTTVLRLKPE